MNNRLIFIGQQSILGRDYTFVETDGYCKMYLSHEQFKRYQSTEPTFSINVTLDTGKIFTKETKFKNDFLSPDKNKVKAVTISRPGGKSDSLVGKSLLEVKGSKSILSPRA